ncbi:xylulose kinase [Leptopilina boulardi]|uniref:xylulose kinase n=1 Tax=Leptopilina boulardi TaxID=63433 RepID=UPI0021F5B665|nr:xylulose kinase [Leptopilina boulardi]
MDEPHNATYLGLDLSTQQLKAIVVNSDLQVICETNVQFDNDLPEFRTYGGVLQKKETPNVATAPTLMWVKALDMILDKLRVCGVDFSKVASISGCAQQHGTVYWTKGGRNSLKTLNPEKFLHEQLAMSFSSTLSPVWMDSSTTKECKLFEETAGSPEKLAELTGSRAYERFSGPQIAKISSEKPEVYSSTERISLISSFMASLFLGDYAPIDFSDASGMNLMDIRSREWCEELLQLCGTNLKDKLGEPVSSLSDIGPVSNYFVERFGFDEGCRIIAFTGDNASSLAGLRLKKEDVVCSLGTSDTLFFGLNEPKTITEGHVFCNSLDDPAYIILLCFKNGSMTRKRICDSAAQGSWPIFNELLESTPRGNFGNLGLYFDSQEILPSIIGDYRFNKANEKINRYSSKEVEVRALIEGQFIAKRAYAEDFGFSIGPNTRIIATGGTSMNKAILQVLADVFNSPVYISNVANSAAMGATYRAKFASLKNDYSFEDIMKNVEEPILMCEPYHDADTIYKPMILRYRNIIEQLTKKL